jgi:hypothetical protein
MIRQFGAGREREKKDFYSNYSSELHSVHRSLHSISCIKGPIWGCGGVHAEVAVCVVCWDFVELEELLMLVRIFYRMEVDDRKYLFSNDCWRSSDLNL